MEKNIETCKSQNINSIMFNELKFKDGVLSVDDNKNFASCFEMSVDKFIEMIYDMVKEGIIINVDSVIFRAHSGIAKSEDKYIHYVKYMNKYRMERLYEFSVGISYIKTLRQIINDDMYKVIHDEYNRHMLRIEIANMKKSIITFLETQKSYDDITRFKKMVKSL